jgi:predicted hydrocarbon binding protein
MSSLERYSSNRLRRLIGSLNSVHFKDDDGEVEYFGQQVVMLRRDAFTLIRDGLTRVAGGAAQVILDIAGHTVGKEEGRAILAKARAPGNRLPQSLPTFIRLAVEETNMGYGKIKIEEFNTESGTVTVSLSNSFEVDPYRHALKPTCAFTLGYLKGIFSQLAGRDFEGREVDCKSKGDPFCKFQLVVRPESNASESESEVKAQAPLSKEKSLDKVQGARP